MEIASRTLTAEEAWEAAVSELQVLVPPATFNTWVRDCHLVGFENGTFVLGVPDSRVRDWLDKRLRSTVARALRGIMGQAVEVRFDVVPGGAPPGGGVGTTAGLPQPPDAAPPGDPDLNRLVGVRKGFLAWLPILGPTLWCIILDLRCRCYWNPRTGELRDVCVASYREIGQAVGVDPRTVQRLVARPEAGVFILERSVVREFGGGRWVAQGTEWRVLMTDPPVPLSNGQFVL